MQAIYQWESRIKVYEEQSGDLVSENIKLQVLQKYLCDGVLLGVHQDRGEEEDGEGQVEVEREEGEVKEKRTWMTMRMR